MKKLIKNVMMVSLVGVLFVGCSSNEESTESSTSSTTAETSDTGLSGTVSVVGSTTVQPVAQDTADAFMEMNPDVSVEIQGVGSSAGVQAAIDGTADIGAASRELKDEELEAGLDEHVIAHDAIAVAVHPDNPVEELTLEEVAQIFTGEITNWSEVGGNDEDIIVISREDGSGTRSAFQEIVGFDAPDEMALISDSNGAVKANLETKPNAIAYISLGVVDDSVKTLAIDGVEPTLETTKDGTYPISRDLLMLTNGEVTAETEAYLDFVLSDEGQEIVGEHYIPVN